MARSWQRRQPGRVEATEDPAVGGTAPWPLPAVLAPAAAGLISPLIPVAGAVLACAMADQDQATILIGAGPVRALLVPTLRPGS